MDMKTPKMPKMSHAIPAVSVKHTPVVSDRTAAVATMIRNGVREPVIQSTGKKGCGCSSKR